MRRGASVLAMVLVVLLMMIVFAFTQAFSRSATSRTVLRITDIRGAFECGDAAIAEAVVLLRENLDSGRASPECPDDWRAIVARAFAGAGGSSYKIVPKRTRETFQLPNLSSTVGDVSCAVVDTMRPESGPPQGVLEMSVRVQVDRLMGSVRKTVRQRRSFYLTWPAELPGAGDPASPATQVTVIGSALGTVVE